LDDLIAFKHAEVARLRPSAGRTPVINTEATSQNLADRGGTARHAVAKTEIVESRQLSVGQHDLKSFAAFSIL
jgi:hypothetical protein